MVLFDPGVSHRIMVCVTPQKSCKRLIERGAAQAEEFGGQFAVVYVNNKRDLNHELKHETLLLELFERAKDLGGNVSILSGDKIYDTIAKFAIKNKATSVIVGTPPADQLPAKQKGELIKSLIKSVESHQIQVEIVV